MYGICEIRRKFEKVGNTKLNLEEKNNYKMNIKTLKKHLKVVGNQKNQFKLLRKTLEENFCILILVSSKISNLQMEGMN